MKILANDGISETGIKILENNGFEVITTKVAQEQIPFSDCSRLCRIQIFLCGQTLSFENLSSPELWPFPFSNFGFDNVLDSTPD